MRNYISSKMLITLSIIITLLVGLRLATPSIITSTINQTLDNTPGIDGSIDDVDLAIYRGAYRLNNLRLYLQEGQQNLPTIQADSVDISVLWSALFHGEFVAEVAIDKANLSFFDAKKAEDNIKQEATEAETWLTLIDSASLISIDRIEISDSQVSVYTTQDSQQTEHYLSDIDGMIRNITNNDDFPGSKIARFDFSGKFMGKASAQLSGSIDPDSQFPTFDINYEMQRLSVTSVDELVDFYAPFDMEAGMIDAAAEIKVVNGELEGYVKAGVFDADVFSWKEDVQKDDDGLFTGLFEGLIDTFANLLKNSDTQLLAIRVPLSGSLADAEVSTWQTFTSLLYNVFVDAYEIRVEDSVGFEEEISTTAQGDTQAECANASKKCSRVAQKFLRAKQRNTF